MAVYKRDIVDINLETGNIYRSFLKHSIGYKDQKADHFGIRTYRDGVPVDLTGVSVQGIFLPPQGDPIAITSGNIVDGNVAEVVLPQACYNYDGQFTLSIKLVDSNNSVTGTMRIVDGMVDNTHASGTVAPTEAVPTYQEILATYEAMLAATTAATTAATNVGSIVAAAYSTSATYAVGDYCTKDGNLYRCTTAITTAESWTAAHWTQTKMGPDVSDLKSALDKYESIINIGSYTIQKSDIESGVWNYTTKSVNSKRLRINRMIPVKKGMVVNYTNPSLDLYIGVAPTPTSGSTGFVTSGWITKGKTNGVYEITIDGYMVFNARLQASGGNDITVNDFNETATLLPVNYSESRMLYFNGTYYKLSGGGFSTVSNQFYNATDRIHTEFISLPQGNYNIETSEGYMLLVAVNNSGTYTLIDAVSNHITIPAISGYTYAIIVKTADSSAITILDDTGLKITPFEPKVLNAEDEEPIELHDVQTYLTYTSPFVDYVAKATDVIKMPKGGISIGTDSSSGSTKTYRVNFYRITDGVFVPATDYQYSGVNWQTQTSFGMTSASLYFPYDDNLYFQVSCTATNADKVHIAYSTESKGYGRLLTLGMIGMSITNNVPTPNFKNYIGGYKTSQYLDGSVVRLEDVRRIVCSPKYSMSAWIYDSDDNLIKAIYGVAMVGAAFGGLSEIDLSEYNDTDGYAVIVIMGTQTRDGSTTNSETMGCLARHDDVLNNVFVEYTNKTVIFHKPGMNPIIAKNIETLKRLRFPAVLAFNYRGNWTSKPMRMNEMHDATLGFYGGSSVANVPLSNVTMKSYATAVQNVNSRVYAGNWMKPNPGYITGGYGMICSNLPQVLCGIEHATDSFGFWVFTNYMDHETESFTLENAAEVIKPGDWMHGRDIETEKPDYHVGLVTDVIYINNAPFCVEYIEAYPAMLRYRYMYLTEPYRRFDREYSAGEGQDNYYCLVSRPPQSDLSLWGSKWDLDIDYNVGTIMCDRGTDSVYCAGNKYCYITIADENITSIDLYVDGTKRKTITLENREKITLTPSAPQAIDIISDIQECGAGYYTLIPNNKSTVQESFFVPLTPGDISIEFTDEGRTISITPPETSYEIVQLWARYFVRTDSGDDYVNETDYYYNPDTGEWEEMEVPHGGETPTGKTSAPFEWKVNTMRDGKFIIPESIPYLDYLYHFDYCNIVYKTDYGTFCLGRDIGGAGVAPIGWCNTDREVVNTHPIV